VSGRWVGPDDWPDGASHVGTDAISRRHVHAKVNLPEHRNCAEGAQRHAGSMGSLAPKEVSDGPAASVTC
jgi:hypothetical protein